ncbi:26255_t:CDS:1, partial [Gigaspora rosea]
FLEMLNQIWQKQDKLSVKKSKSSIIISKEERPKYENDSDIMH